MPSSLRASSSKTRMNSAPDDFPFLLRIGHAGQLAQEALGGVHIDEIRTQLLLEHLDHLLRLAFAAAAVIDVHAGELIPDSPQEQGGDHEEPRRPDQGQQHLFYRPPDGEPLRSDPR